MRSIPTTRRSPPPCALWSAPARARDQESKHAHSTTRSWRAYRHAATSHSKQTPSAAYRDCGYFRRVGGQAKRSSTCTVGGSTLAPPRRTAIWSGRSPRERERGLLSRTIGLLPNIHFRLPRTTCGHATKDLPSGTCTGLRSPETPREGTWPSDSRRALPAQPPPATRLSSELPWC